MNDIFIYQQLMQIIYDNRDAVSKKIENLLATNYPKEKLEIIFIDDSTDSTPKIIQEFTEKYPFIPVWICTFMT